MIKKNSIYSLNKKNPDAIVYPSATGKPVFVTREDFPSEVQIPTPMNHLHGEFRPVKR